MILCVSNFFTVHSHTVKLTDTMNLVFLIISKQLFPRLSSSCLLCMFSKWNKCEVIFFPNQDFWEIFQMLLFHKNTSRWRHVPTICGPESSHMSDVFIMTTAKQKSTLRASGRCADTIER